MCRWVLILMAMVWWMQEPRWVQACSVCFYGEPDDPLNKGLRMGIVALLVVLLVVLALLAKFFLSVRKRSRMMSEEYNQEE